MNFKFFKIKKGNLTSTQLVTIILIIAGLAIIVFFIYQMNWTGNVDRETCHTSVVLRGTLPNIPVGSPKDIVPLKCKTRKICISDNLLQKGECNKNSENVLGEKFDTVRVSNDLEKQDTQIKMTIAREMADCWSMMGEGKLQLFPRQYFDYDSKCVICSIIDFENDEIKKKNKEVYGTGYYLMSHLVPNTNKTYWEYLSRSNVDNLFVIGGNGELKNADKMDITKPKTVVYLEMERSYAGSLFGIEIGGTAGAVVGAKVGTILGSVVPGAGNVVGAGVGFIVGGIIGANVVDPIYKTAVQGFQSDSKAGLFLADYNPEDFRKLGCDSLENIP